MDSLSSDGKISIAEDIVQESFLQCFRNKKKKPETFRCGLTVCFANLLAYGVKGKEKTGKPEAEALSELKSNRILLKRLNRTK